MFMGSWINSPFFRILSATLLVAGTCIGAGMLALPVTTFQMGFFPSLAAMTACWLFMTFSALLLAEASLWMEEGSHYITLSKRLLGFWGKALSWILYLFIAYATLMAYTAEGGMLVHSLCMYILHIKTEVISTTIVFCLCFSAILLTGSRVIGAINTLLMSGIVITYLFLVTKTYPFIHVEWLKHTEWPRALYGIPLMLTVFSFQSIVPSLTTHLKRDGKALRLSIILGTTLAFVVYAVWQMIILGAIPSYGEYSLHYTWSQGTSIATIIRHVIDDPWIVLFTECFAFFAIVTSFLGIGLGLFDFLSDGLKIQKTQKGSLALIALIIVPVLILALSYPRIFIVALESTGAFGDTLLNGILPALMVWRGRYHFKLPGDQRIAGGRISLIIVILFACFAIAAGC